MIYLFPGKKKDVLAKISIFQAKLCCSRASWGFS